MSDGEHPEESNYSEVEESTGDAALDERLSEPVFTGQRGLDKAQVGISAFLIILVGGITFLPALAVPFHHADQVVIVENEALHRVVSISDGWDSYVLRPIAALSVAVDWQISGGSSQFLHVVNILIHLFNGVLVYLLCRRLLQKVQPEAMAMAGGMLFVVHPAVTQSVNTVLDCSVLLATFFTLLSLVLYLRASSDKENPSPMGVGGSLLCFALAWGSHVMAWVTPLLVLLVDAAARRDVTPKARALTQTPYWIALMLLLIVHAGSGAFGSDSLPTIGQAMGQISSFYAYLPVMVNPGQLSTAHPPLVASGLPIVWAVMVALGITAMRFLPVLGLALLWMLLTLVASSFFIADASLVEERLYLPLAGVVLVAPWLLNLTPKSGVRSMAGVIVAVLIVTLGTLTFFRNQVWQSEDALWTNAALACPACAEPPARLGDVHLELGEGLIALAQEAAALQNTEQFNMHRQEALAEFEAAGRFFTVAVQQPSPSPEVWQGLGKAQRFLGKFEDARTSCLQALEIDPGDFGCTLELALNYGEKALSGGQAADRQKALDYYRRAQLLGPLPTSALLMYSTLLTAVGNVASAGGILQSLVSAESNAQLQTRLSHLEVKRRTMMELQNQAAELARANPLDPEILAMRATQMFVQDDFLAAAYLVEQVFRERAPDLNLWTILGMSKARLGGLSVFFEEWVAPPTVPGGGSPWLHLARNSAAAGQWDMAVSTVQHASALGALTNPPLVELGDIAQGWKDLHRAEGLYRTAAQQSPTDPTPVLRLAELSIAAKHTQEISVWLSEAQRRGAPKDVIDDLRKQAGLEETDIRPPVRTIIQ